VNAGPSTPQSTPPPGPAAQPRRLYLPVVRPRLTQIIIAVTVLVFIAQYVSQSTLGVDLVLLYGAKSNAAIAAGQYWRLITPIFIHANLLHIFVNMYSLYIIGPPVEAPYGYARFLLIYFLSGIAGVVLSFALSPNPSIGASGAIFGLVGALSEYFFRHRHRFGQMGRRQLTNLLVVIGLNLVFGLTASQIDNWGHLGGLAGGFVLSWLIGPDFALDPNSPGEPRVIDRNPLSGRWLAVASFALALGAAVSLIISFQHLSGS
jgi:rhomboid protease GluP